MSTPNAPQVEPRYAGIVEFVAKMAFLGGPVLYVLGRVYADGYWSTLGVSPSVMGGDAEDYIYWGFIVVAGGLASLIPNLDKFPLWAAPLASLLLAAALALSIWVFGRVRSWLVEKLSQLGKRLRSVANEKKSALEALAALDTAFSLTSAACSILLAFLIISAALLLPIVVAHSVGETRAHKVAEHLRKGLARFAAVRVDGQADAQLVECSEEYCAVYANGQFRPVPINTVHWVEARAHPR